MKGCTHIRKPMPYDLKSIICLIMNQSYTSIHAQWCISSEIPSLIRAVANLPSTPLARSSASLCGLLTTTRRRRQSPSRSPRRWSPSSSCCLVAGRAPRRHAASRPHRIVSALPSLVVDSSLPSQSLARRRAVSLPLADPQNRFVGVITCLLLIS